MDKNENDVILVTTNHINSYEKCCISYFFFFFFLLNFFVTKIFSYTVSLINLDQKVTMF